MIKLEREDAIQIQTYLASTMINNVQTGIYTPGLFEMVAALQGALDSDTLNPETDEDESLVNQQSTQTQRPIGLKTDPKRGI